MNEQEKKFLTDTKLQFNSLFNFAVDVVNSETKTVSVILSDETEVIRWDWDKGFFDVILVHTPEAVDLSRKDIMPLLVQHERDMLPIGTWKNIRIEDAKLKGDAVFDEGDEFAMEVFGKFERKIMKSFSVGLGSWNLQLFEEKNKNGRTTFKAIEWSLDECSVVTIPANPNAIAGFEKENNTQEVENNANPNKTCYNNDETKNKEEISMDIKTFLAEHPSVYAEVFNLGKKDGAKDESDRINAHLEMAKTTGANQYALECIGNGEGLSQTAIAKYTTFGMNKQDVENKDLDNVDNVDTPESKDLAKVEKTEKEDERNKIFAKAMKVDLKSIEGNK